MAALDPAVAAIRLAVRDGVAVLAPGHGVLVACSGGADSMALAAAAAFVLPRAGRRAGLCTVDHGLQAGSAQRAADVAAWATKVGFDPVIVSNVDVSGRTGGPEAAARDARYEALLAAATDHGCGTVALGHTRDDQAETVLLALVRGAGPRGMAGMAAHRVTGDVGLLRPLLDLPRAQTRAACTALGLPVWDDPHNVDPAYRRTHARALLASMVESLGPAVVSNLAHTARLAAADNAALDRLAAEALDRAAGARGLRVADLTGLPDAIRTRVLHAYARTLGVGGAALSHRHIDALDALVVAWRGQGVVSLPGGLGVGRRDGYLGPHPGASLGASLGAPPGAPLGRTDVIDQPAD